MGVFMEWLAALPACRVFAEVGLVEGVTTVAEVLKEQAALMERPAILIILIY